MKKAMENEIIFNELVIDDPEFMKLDDTYKCYKLFQIIGEVALSLQEDFPDEYHIVYVRVPCE